MHNTPSPTLSRPAATLLRRAARQYHEHSLDYWPLHSGYQAIADELLMAGLIRHHPEAAKRTWYGLTDSGLAEGDRLNRESDGASPLQRRLLAARRERFDRIAGELRDQGYFILPEPGRGWQFGEVAFYRPADGRRVLLTCRIGSVDWREYDRFYYRPVDIQPDPLALDMPF